MRKFFVMCVALIVAASSTMSQNLFSIKDIADNKDQLTAGEKQQVEDAIRGTNTFPEHTNVEVADNGDTTITYPDGSKDTISGNDLVSQRETSATPVVNPVDSDDTALTGTGVAGDASCHRFASQPEDLGFYAVPAQDTLHLMQRGVGTAMLVGAAVDQKGLHGPVEASGL